jgi:hypothetical protein
MLQFWRPETGVNQISTQSARRYAIQRKRTNGISASRHHQEKRIYRDLSAVCAHYFSIPFEEFHRLHVCYRGQFGKELLEKFCVIHGGLLDVWQFRSRF